MRRDVMTLYRGSTWTQTWPLSDADGRPWAWQPTDTVHGQLRAGHAAGAILHEWDGAVTGVNTSVDGELTLTIDYQLSEGWTVRRCVADVEITRAWVRARPIGFTLIVDHDITV